MKSTLYMGADSGDSEQLFRRDGEHLNHSEAGHCLLKPRASTGPGLQLPEFRHFGSIFINEIIIAGIT
jgi:hypothetical protein